MVMSLTESIALDYISKLIVLLARSPGGNVQCRGLPANAYGSRRFRRSGLQPRRIVSVLKGFLALKLQWLKPAIPWPRMSELKPGPPRDGARKESNMSRKIPASAATLIFIAT